MKEKKDNTNTNQTQENIKEPELSTLNITDQTKDENQNVITIDIKPFLVPISIFLSAIIIASSVLIGINNVASSLKGGITTNATAAATTPTATTTTPTTTAQTAVSLDTIKNLYKGDYIKFGDENKKILFVEVGDPSCPYCHIAGGLNPTLNKSSGSQFTLVADGGTYVAPVPEMRKLVDSGQASFLYVYTPGHGNGEMGMKALYCANAQGKFWVVHDLLMSSGGYDLQNNQVKNDKTKSQQVADFLKSAIDPTYMKSCLDSGKYDSRITSDPTIAASLGVQGTPGFFINAKNFAGAYSWTDMKSVADAALKS